MNRNRPVLSRITMILFVIMFMLAGFSDEDTRYLKIRSALEKFSYVYPQQKVFLHLDKPVYLGGESMWIKAYLVNGIDHLPDTLSTNLYVELISPFQTRVEIKRFQMFNGFGAGDFVLSDTLPEGLYQIRAYTNWMQNFDADFYFRQNFQLYNPGYRKLISPKEARSNRKELDNMDKLAVDYDLQFMPEGGDLVTGMESVVGFKCINKLGRGVDIEGRIVDKKGNQVSSFKSYYKGIGRFLFTPEKDREYFAVTVVDGKEIRTPMPKPLETGVILHAEDHPDKVTLSFRSNRFPTADRTANEIIVTGQVGGKIYYHDILTLKDGNAGTEIPKASIPGGIMQITAFSGRGEPMAERLVYVNHLNYLNINLSAIDTLMEDGRKIYLDVFTTDRQKNPIQANLSLSVTREIEEQSPSNHENIISNLLMTSDLKGFVEDPLDYFRDQSEATLTALDNLMLTQGWRRFDWNMILADEYPKIRHHEEKGITVFGMITRDFFNLPLKNCKVQLSIMDEYNDVFSQYTNEKGFFLFENMVYYDTISVKLEAWRTSGRRNLVIVLPGEEPAAVGGQQGEYELTTLSERDNKAYRTERAEETRQDMREAEEREKKAREEMVPVLYGEPDYILKSEDFPQGNRDILEVMKGRIPGVSIYGDQIMIRGPNSIMMSTQPLFLIDGVPTRDVGAIKAIPVEDIERIEVLKGPSASIYGVQGANGVIAVYTKRGHYMNRGILEFDMLGYHRTRQFYQPRYLPQDEPAHNYTLIWEPVIQTDASGKARLIFDKPEIKGDYRFVIQGISYFGHVGFEDSVITNQ
jgi:TonB-dependent SusC/RagA subfamily outer membrane receptor